MMLALVRAMMSGRATPLSVLLGDDLHLVGQAGAQRAERDGLVGCRLPISVASSSTPVTFTRSAVRAPSRRPSRRS